MLIRFFDVILSGIALLVFLPLLAPIMVFLKFSGEGEVFFFKSVLAKIKKHLSLLN